MHTAQPAIADLAEGLETPVQLIYLSLLVVLLSGAAFIVVRQVLVQREMDERSKVLSELIRTGEATSEDYFELGVVLARRKLFTQALKNYNKAIKLWDGDETELAQVRLLSMLQCNTQCAPSCLLGASRGIDGAAGHRSCCCRCGSALAIQMQMQRRRARQRNLEFRQWACRCTTQWGIATKTQPSLVTP